MNLFISNWDSNIVGDEHEYKQVGDVSSKLTTVTHAMKLWAFCFPSMYTH